MGKADVGHQVVVPLSQILSARRPRQRFSHRLTVRKATVRIDEFCSYVAMGPVGASGPRPKPLDPSPAIKTLRFALIQEPD